MITWLTASENATLFRDVFMEMIELLHRHPLVDVLEKGTKCEISSPPE